MRLEAADVVAESERCFIGNRPGQIPVTAPSSPGSHGLISRFQFSEQTTPQQPPTPPNGSLAAGLGIDGTWMRGASPAAASPSVLYEGVSEAFQMHQPQQGQQQQHLAVPAVTGSEAEMSKSQSQVVMLEREIALLRDNLNYEQHLRAQHNQHLGTLHRQHVLESGVEAERQTLYNKVRTYRDQLAQKTAELERTRAEAATSKAMHIKWENDLAVKNRALREQERQWSEEANRLRADLARAKVRKLFSSFFFAFRC
jgi:hypothetical protein